MNKTEIDTKKMARDAEDPNFTSSVIGNWISLF